MAEPLSLIALGAAIGGGAGKFVERAWDSGEKWLSSYFSNHQEKARQKGQENSLSFLTDLARRLERLEAEKRLSSEKIATAQEHPDFSVVLQKALLSSAQTESKDKHQLLSRLVAERIASAPESLMALASKMACDAISYTTINQLNIMGLATNIMYISPNGKLDEQQYFHWLQTRIGPFLGTKATVLDYTHLEALSCLKYESFLTRDLKQTLTNNAGQINFNFDAFKVSPLGLFLTDIWEKQGLKSVQLTSVGQIIGVMVSDQTTGTTTNMTGWESL